MSAYTLTPSESKFADLVWMNEPLTSAELVRLSESEMKWKKSTTFTVLKKLCEKGIFKNENAIVSSVLNREQYYSAQSRRYVEDSFDGSLPKFIAAFTSGGKLNESQIEELKRLIDTYSED
jgi:Predicted transcriptional regulator